MFWGTQYTFKDKSVNILFINQNCIIFCIWDSIWLFICQYFVDQWNCIFFFFLKTAHANLFPTWSSATLGVQDRFINKGFHSLMKIIEGFYPLKMISGRHLLNLKKCNHHSLYDGVHVIQGLFTGHGINWKHKAILRINDIDLHKKATNCTFTAKSMQIEQYFWVVLESISFI